MLTEKDYCDYETCVALKELGYKVPTSAYYMPNNSQLLFVPNPFRDGYVIDCFGSHNSFPKDVITSNYIDAPTMWEAQKWLREEKEIAVFVTYDKNTSKWFATVINMDSLETINMAKCNLYEEALSEGIKCAVKILKERYDKDDNTCQ